MKNWIYYYYNLNSNDIHQIGGTYKFEVDNSNYILLKCDRNQNEIEEIYKLTNYLRNNQIYCHEIVINNLKKPVTLINSEPYILLKLYDKMDTPIKIDHIVFFSALAYNTDNKSNLLRSDWKRLWSDKIDYFEYQVSQFGKKYPIIRESFSYYVGMVETGISLLSSTSSNNELVIAHRRLKKDNTTFDLYNPLNFIIDIKVRDAAEYFKELFVTKKDIYSEVEEYIIKNKFNQNDCYLFFIRMLYPSFYFDRYEQIIEELADEKILLPIINLADDYELLLKKIYIFLSKHIKMPDIEWIKKI